ncbi:hypothetical protein [Alteromonas sp. A079]|uniref:hypothetical protein n=1 Tax=Alteromonas sp. A079 TaxID=3410268 RepID=UPI003BA2A10F
MRVIHTVLMFLRAYLPAWLTTYLVASILHTQFVLLNLVQLNVDIAPRKWLMTTFADIQGLLLLYGSAISATLLIAMIVANWLTTRRHCSSTVRRFIYVLAGAVGMWVMLAAMQPILNVTLIAGARSTLGVIMQCVAGGLGGFVFAVCHKPQDRSKPSSL